MTKDPYTPQCLQDLGAHYDPAFRFDPVEHKYTFEGREMTGTTTILAGVKNPAALLGWAANMAVDAMLAGLSEEEARKAHITRRDARRDEGIGTHALVEQYIKDSIEQYGGRALVPLQPELEPFAHWAQNEKIIFLGSEVPVYYREGFVGGIIDFLFMKGGRVYVGDLKTNKKPRYGSGVYYSYWMQLASYRNAIESLGGKVDGQCIVRMSSDFEVAWRDNYAADKRAFLGALDIYRATREYESAYQLNIK